MSVETTERVTVFNVDSGEAIEVFNIDATELVESGQYTTEAPKKSKKS